jgi:hypothetical protein
MKENESKILPPSCTTRLCRIFSRQPLMLEKKKQSIFTIIIFLSVRS